MSLRLSTVHGQPYAGKDGQIPLGDLITVICSYDETAEYTSNALSSYFHDLGWRQRLNDRVLHEWLGVSENETLGGNYGEDTPSDLSFTLHAKQGDEDYNCEMDKDPHPIIYSNHITALTAAELVRRLILHRELPLEMRFPDVEWDDILQLLYGAGKETARFPGTIE